MQTQSDCVTENCFIVSRKFCLSVKSIESHDERLSNVNFLVPTPFSTCFVLSSMSVTSEASLCQGNFVFAPILPQHPTCYCLSRNSSVNEVAGCLILLPDELSENLSKGPPCHREFDTCHALNRKAMRNHLVENRTFGWEIWRALKKVARQVEWDVTAMRNRLWSTNLFVRELTGNENKQSHRSLACDACGDIANMLLSTSILILQWV